MVLLHILSLQLAVRIIAFVVDAVVGEILMTQKIRIDVGFFLSFEKNQECKKDKNISNKLCILYVLLTSMKINIFNVKLMNKNFMNKNC